MYGISSTCVVHHLQVWFDIYMYGTSSTRMVHHLNVWYIIYMYGISSTCVVHHLHVWYIVYMYGTSSTCMVHHLQARMQGVVHWVHVHPPPGKKVPLRNVGKNNVQVPLRCDKNKTKEVG